MASPLIAASSLLVPPPTDADDADPTEILAGRDLALELLAHPLEPSPAACSSTFLSHPELQAAATLGTLRALGVLDRALVVVVRGGVSRPAVLCALPDEAEGDAAAHTLYCSPLLLHNLRAARGARADVRAARGVASEAGALPPFAAKVCIARVRAPRADGALSVARGANAAEERLAARALRRHFARRRLLCAGDTFAASTAPARAATAFDAATGSDTSDDSDDDARGGGGGGVLDGTMTMLFRVLSIESKSGVIESRGGGSGGVASVQRGETTMLERPSVRAAPPAHLGAFVAPPADAPPPAGASEAAAALRDAIAVALSSSAPPAGADKDAPPRLRPSLLLHSAAGGGKRELVTQLCDELGVHCCVRNVATLLRSGEAPKPSALAALLSEARRCAPCVLLLRRLELIGDVVAAASTGAAGAAGAAEGRRYVDETARALERAMAASDTAADTAADAVDADDDEGGGGGGAGAVLVVATARSLEGVPAPLRRCFSGVHAMAPPPAAESLGAFVTQLRAHGADGELCAAAPKIFAATPRLTPREWGLVCAHGRMIARRRAAAAALRRRKKGGAADAAADAGADAADADADADDDQLLEEHIVEALKRRAAEAKAASGSVSIPDVKWDDVGGQAEAKAAILETVELPLKAPHLFGDGMRTRSGVLLYGPPGNGKTLIAKAVASQCALAFLSVKGPELLSSYVGESERLVREVFEKGRAAAPCVIFFDEIDALAPARGATADAGGVMDRVVSQLMAEIDGVGSSKKSELFVLAATNRPDLLDDALLRPGRFDRLVYLGPPEGATERLRVLRALTRRFTMADGVDLEAVAARCPEGVSGADLYGLCADALLRAISEHIDAEEAAAAEAEGGGGGEVAAAAEEEEEGEEGVALPPIVVPVGARHFEAALAELQPSVSAAEAAEYARVRASFETGGGGAGGAGAGRAASSVVQRVMMS